MGAAEPLWLLAGRSRELAIATSTAHAFYHRQ
jgi:hypothetical protein